MSNNTEIQTSYESEIKDEWKVLIEEIQATTDSATSATNRGAKIGDLIISNHQQNHRGQSADTWLRPLLGDMFSDAVFRFCGRAARIKSRLDNPDQRWFTFAALSDGEPTTTGGDDAKPTSHDSSPFAAFNASALKLRHTLDQFIKARPPSKWTDREAEQIKGLVEPIINLAKQEGWL